MWSSEPVCTLQQVSQSLLRIPLKLSKAESDHPPVLNTMRKPRAVLYSETYVNMHSL